MLHFTQKMRHRSEERINARRQSAWHNAPNRWVDRKIFLAQWRCACINIIDTESPSWALIWAPHAASKKVQGKSRSRFLMDGGKCSTVSPLERIDGKWFCSWRSKQTVLTGICIWEILSRSTLPGCPPAHTRTVSQSQSPQLIATRRKARTQGIPDWPGVGSRRIGNWRLEDGGLRMGPQLAASASGSAAFLAFVWENEPGELIFNLLGIL